MNTTTTTTSTTTAEAKKPRAPRKPRAKKDDATKPVETAQEAAKDTKPVQEAPKATAPANTATSAARAAVAAALCVFVTLPPVEKFQQGLGYWHIEIKDEAGRRYSDIYRIKDLDKARDLAEKMARDRKLPIITQEPPSPRQLEQTRIELDVGDLHDITPEEAEQDTPKVGLDFADNDEPTPF